jgi:CPA1 family monovalent cation:H+ antiporter
VLTPFVAYWPPEQLGGSGVLATVVAGLYISWNGLRLISAATRLQGIFFWDYLIYLIEGMVFLITGLQAHALLAGIGGHKISELATAAGIVTAVVILARFAWMYPATYLPRWLIPAIRRADPSPPWQYPFVLAFTGIRGIVSLAAALAIPFATGAGAPFPYREMILFVTFVVILATLVGQGLLLPLVVSGLGLARAGRREHRADRIEEFEARRHAIEAAVARLDALHEARPLPPEILDPLRADHRERLNQVERRKDGDPAHRKLTDLTDEVRMALIAAERDGLNALYRGGGVKDEARRRIERDLDLREAHLANLRDEG